MFSNSDLLYMLLAVSEAKKFIGATAPNPPVGACLVNNGKILGIGAHPIAGAAHAESIAIDRAIQQYGHEAIEGSTLYVTLEPCNHTGKTPPCSEEIIKNKIKRVVFGVDDPNPNVTGNGKQKLLAAGIKVESGLAKNECADLIHAFTKWTKTTRPWIVHKLAYRVTRTGELSMVPEKGIRTTFTSPQSLFEAHLERRKSDAILTGIGTVLSDSPKFNVRHLTDHENRRRILVVLSNDGSEVPQHWLEQEWNLGFEVLVFKEFQEALKVLGELGVQRLLIEAGPNLSKYIIENNLWDERLIFVQNFTDTSRNIIPLDLNYRELNTKSVV